MLAFEGDTGPYLQYALVRVKSILRNAADRFDINTDALTRTDGATDSPPPILIDEPAEKELALEILRHPGVIASAAEALEPHRLCGHLFSLATAFSAFFQHCPVLQAPDDETRLSRLRMCALTGRALESGLETLGIKALERM
jgi:arginyl-tRNA synthetase